MPRTKRIVEPVAPVPFTDTEILNRTAELRSVTADNLRKRLIDRLRLMSRDLAMAADRIEEDPHNPYAINSLGIIQSSGPMLDVMAARYCQILEDLREFRQLKAYGQSGPTVEDPIAASD